MSRAFPVRPAIASVIAISAPAPAMTCLARRAPAFADPGVEQPVEVSAPTTSSSL